VRGGELARALSRDPPLNHPDPEQVDASVQRALAPLGRERGDPPFPITRGLKHAMWEGCGVVRDRVRLEDCARRLESLREQAEQIAVPGAAAANPAWQESLDLLNQLTVARVIVASALARTESRGAHYRADFPERDDARWMRCLVARPGSDGEPVLEERPVELTRHRPEPAAEEAAT
jgi:succinate dehydrogenase/fumarate reductase flavoprotein subunit